MPDEITEKESAALDAVEVSLRTLNEASKALGVKSKRAASSMDPFADLSGTPALDAVVVGKPIMSDAELGALTKRIRQAKTSRERLYEVVAVLAKIGATAAKAMA